MGETYYRTIASKLQMTIPAGLCRKLGLKQGDRISLRVDGKRRRLVGEVLRTQIKEDMDV